MVEYIVAIDVTRVRFPADAFLYLRGKTAQVLINRRSASWTRGVRVSTVASDVGNPGSIPGEALCASPCAASPLLALAAWSSDMILA